MNDYKQKALERAYSPSGPLNIYILQQECLPPGLLSQLGELARSTRLCCICRSGGSALENRLPQSSFSLNCSWSSFANKALAFFPSQNMAQPPCRMSLSSPNWGLDETLPSTSHSSLISRNNSLQQTGLMGFFVFFFFFSLGTEAGCQKKLLIQPFLLSQMQSVYW